MVDREAFDRIKQKHGRYGSWAVWAKPAGKPKSNVGDLSVLDPDHNATLLQTLRDDVVMLGLNLSRSFPTAAFANFHDPSPRAQDYKIRFAFMDTPYWGAYMTDLIKGVVMLEAGGLLRYLAANPSAIAQSVAALLDEFADLNCASPTVIAFGNDVCRLAAEHVPSCRYSRLIGVTHYSQYISKENYRARVMNELDHETCT